MALPDFDQLCGLASAVGLSVPHLQNSIVVSDCPTALQRSPAGPEMRPWACGGAMESGRGQRGLCKIASVYACSQQMSFAAAIVKAGGRRSKLHLVGRAAPGVSLGESSTETDGDPVLAGAAPVPSSRGGGGRR